MSAGTSLFHDSHTLVQKAAAVESWFAVRIPQGESVPFCDDCGVHHTGRLSYALLIQQWLWDQTKDKKYKDGAVVLAEYLRGCLRTTPSGALIFHPGGLDPRNGASTVIDSGSATDALARNIIWSRENGIEIDPVWVNTLFDHAHSYLQVAAIDKVCVNQRLWGATGIASLLEVRSDQLLRVSLRKAVATTLDQQWPDGGNPYIVEKTHNPLHGMEAFSPFYHGRTLAFLHYCANAIGGGNDIAKGFLAGVELLRACYGPLGRKVMALETKKWFFQVSYEVESNAYDIYCFRAAYAMTGDRRFLDVWRASEETYLSHITDNGVIACANGGLSDGKDQTVFCNFINNADFAWFLRSLMLPVPDSFDRATRPPLPSASVNSGVISLENNSMRVTISLGKPATGLNWGKASGGGVVVSLVRSADQMGKVLEYDPWLGMLGQDVVVKRRGMKGHYGSLPLFSRNLIRDIRQWVGVYRIEWRHRGWRANTKHLITEVFANFWKLKLGIASPQWCPDPTVVFRSPKKIVLRGQCASPQGAHWDLKFERTIELTNRRVSIETSIFGSLDHCSVSKLGMCQDNSNMTFQIVGIMPDKVNYRMETWLSG